MAGVKKIQKSDIIICAFEILRNSGIEKVNARAIAKKLNCSVQPLFYQFNNMSELKDELLNYALKYYQNYILNFNQEISRYKQIGLNYIKFASEEPNIFKFIFMGNYHIDINNFENFDGSYEIVEEILKDNNNISLNQAKKIHLKMWMFTHGIACLIATNTCYFSNNYISELLTEEFKALIKGKEVENEN